MTSRLVAKKYIRSVLALSDGTAPGVPGTERECLEMLISSHKQLRENERLREMKRQQRGWFGRLLWHWFGRWL